MFSIESTRSQCCEPRLAIIIRRDGILVCARACVFLLRFEITAMCLCVRIGCGLKRFVNSVDFLTHACSFQVNWQKKCRVETVPRKPFTATAMDEHRASSFQAVLMFVVLVFFQLCGSQGCCHITRRFSQPARVRKRERVRRCARWGGFGDVPLWPRRTCVSLLHFAFLQSCYDKSCPRSLSSFWKKTDGKSVYKLVTVFL